MMTEKQIVPIPAVVLELSSTLQEQETNNPYITKCTMYFTLSCCPAP